MLQKAHPKSFWVILVLAVLTLVLFWALPFESILTERWYSLGMFRIIRNLWDHTIGFSPFPIIYIVLLLSFSYIIGPLVLRRFNKSRLKCLGFRIVKLCSIAVLMFYWLWGFNYKRTSFHKVQELPIERPGKEFVEAEYCRVTDSLFALRPKIIVPSEDLYTESQLRTDLKRAFSFLNLETYGRVRVRKIRPKGSLLRISTAGVYLPFAGEGHIDAGLHPITHPFTMMHEMSHGFGWTGEDVCNFLALVGTINSTSIFTKYSGYFGYWRYLRGQIYLIDRDLFNTLSFEIPPIIKSDYQEILAYSDRYPDILPQLRDIFYDQYLRSHGIPSGLINYSQMIILAFQWQEKYGSLLFDEMSDTKG